MLHLEYAMYYLPLIGQGFMEPCFYEDGNNLLIQP